jgi:hypothetical protein
MAKELPYFRFTASEWLNDDISLESYIHKGIFIDVCAYFWSQDCDVTLVKLKKRFSNATNLIDDLVKVNIIKHENKHDKINIDFLVTQYDLLSEKRKLRQSAGSKGGNAKAMLKQKPSYKDKDNDNNNYKEKDNIKSFFESLLNGSDLETIAMNNKITLEGAKKCVEIFRPKAELSYQSYAKFVAHFKNWLAKNPYKDPLIPTLTR